MTIRAFIIAVVAIAGLILADALPGAVPATSANSGLANPGFELGLLDGAPSGWSVVQAPDAVVVTDTEGPSEFPTYGDMGNVTVAPYDGDRMLRLGTPQRVAQNQERDGNAVAQTFLSTGDVVTLAVRVFSWEHRGRDSVKFDLRSSTGTVGTLAADFVLTMPDGSESSCSAMPCDLSIDVGSNGTFLDSGWLPVEITGVPAETILTLSYSIGGTNDKSHPTWGYFDSAEQGPAQPAVSKFTFSPSTIFEGDDVQFEDRSFDDSDIVDWQWTIEGIAVEAQNPAWVFSDEGEYEATLTVTSEDGDVSTVSTGDTAADGTLIPPIVVGNRDPLVNALNTEALAGQPAPIVARFADPGHTDLHDAELRLTGTLLSSELDENNDPTYATGIVEGAGAASATTSGTVTVEDRDTPIGSDSDSYAFTIVTEGSSRHELTNNSLASPPVLESDGSYLSWIQSSGDVDFFEVKLAGGRSLPAGAEVLVRLRDLPADFDLALVSTGGAAGVDAGDSSATLFETSGWAKSGWAKSGWAKSGWAKSGWAKSGFSLEQLPLSQSGFTGLGGDEISGTDIGLGELGLSAIELDGIRVGGFSANRGLADDTVLLTTTGDGVRVFIAVIGGNGEFTAAAPYRLQVEASAPLNVEAVIGSEACTGAPVVTTGATSDITLLHDNPLPPRTLFVTQRERMRNLFSMSDADWTLLLGDLTTLSLHPAVGGEVISLPSSIYNDWDSNPCSIEAANAVTDQIFGRLQLHPGFAGAEYVVFVGDDGIVPFRRVPDETTISNERDYEFDSQLRVGSPSWVAIALGFNITDDFYTDPDPIAWRGRELYVPDVPVSRLVETPGEIRAAAQAFIVSNGVLNPQSGFVSGYDFFDDGATQAAGTLGTAVNTSTLIRDDWEADDLRCRFLGHSLSVPPLTGCATPSISLPNAHFTHFAAQSAKSFNTVDLDDFLSSSDVAGATLPATGLVFSMGCHAGFSAPDRDALAPDLGRGYDPALDFAQAMQTAVFVASTGFGLGDDVGIGGTERLMTLFAEDLVSGDITAGNALLAAKQRYILTTTEMTVYDEKSSIGLSLYGLPMYRIVTGGGAGAAAASVPADAGTGAALPGLSLTVVDGASETALPTIPYVIETAANGQYITAGGDAQSTAARPIQPRVVLGDVSGPVLIHGALPLAGTYEDMFNFDPVIVRPTTEWEFGAGEPNVCLDSFWPSVLTEVNSLPTAGGLAQEAIVTPAEFRCDEAGPVRGLERLFGSLRVELLRCTSDDFTPPVIHRVELLMMPGGTVRASVDASDDSGIKRLIALRFSTGAFTSTIANVPAESSPPYTVDIPDVGADDSLVVYVQDNNCNLSAATGKGAKLTALIIDAGDARPFVPGEPADFPVKVFNIAALTGPLYFEWDFGDGTVESGTLNPGDLVPDGADATFTKQHTYATVGETGTARIKVLDAAGGIALDSVVYACDQASDGDGDGLSICLEAAIGTDANDHDTDGDGCSDGREVLQPDEALGGQRDPLDFWDFYDMTGDREIDLADTLFILSFFGNDGTSPIGNLVDRQVVNEAQPWRTAQSDDGIDLIDALANLRSFGHTCLDSPSIG